MTVVYLAVPKKGVHITRWRNAVRKSVLADRHVFAYVFHSRHIKVWATEKPKLKASRVIKAKDRTVHHDRVLLTFAYSMTLRAEEKGYSHETAAAITTHYLFNMAGKGYGDEAKFHKARSKTMPRTTARQDHGWEIDELKKAGML